MKLGLRLRLGFLGMAALVGGVGLIGLWAQQGLRQHVADLVQHHMPELIMFGEIKATGARMQEWALSLALEASLRSAAAPPAAGDAQDQHERMYRMLRGHIRQYAQGATTDEERAMVMEIERASLALYQVGQEVIGAARRSSANEEQVENRARLEAAEEAFGAAVNRIVNFENEELREAAEAADRTGAAATTLSLIALAMTILLAVILSAALTRRIARPIQALVEAAAAVAAGAYEHRVEASSQDEVGQLAVAFNEMAQGLRGAIERETTLAARAAQTVALAEQQRAGELQALNERLAQANQELTKEVGQRKTAEEALRGKNQELEQRNQIMFGREERVLELKREINALLAAAGKPPKYGAQ